MGGDFQTFYVWDTFEEIKGLSQISMCFFSLEEGVFYCDNEFTVRVPFLLKQLSGEKNSKNSNIFLFYSSLLGKDYKVE